MKRIVVAAAFLALLWTPAVTGQSFGDSVLEGVQLTGRGGTEYTDLINLLIERGRSAPAQELLSLTSSQRVTIRIEGPAQFNYQSGAEGDVFVSEVSYEMDSVALPRLVPGAVDSRLYVEIEGEEPWDPILVRMVDQGHVERFLPVPFFSDMVLRASADWGFALLDFALLDVDKVEKDVEDFPAPPRPMEVCFYYGPNGLGGDQPPSPLVPCEDPHICPPSVWSVAPPLYQFPENECITYFQLTGRFTMNGGVQSGYSYLPETGGNLKRVTKVTTTGIDAVYWTGWGCNKALKVPDNVISVAYANGQGGWCCRGPIAIAAGKNCSWVTPGLPGPESNWPDCPLP